MLLFFISVCIFYCFFIKNSSFIGKMSFVKVRFMCANFVLMPQNGSKHAIEVKSCVSHRNNCTTLMNDSTFAKLIIKLICRVRTQFAIWIVNRFQGSTSSWRGFSRDIPNVYFKTHCDVATELVNSVKEQTYIWTHCDHDHQHTSDQKADGRNSANHKI